MSVVEDLTDEDVFDIEQRALWRKFLTLMVNRRPAELGFRRATFEWIVAETLAGKGIGRESEEGLWLRIEAAWHLNVLKVDGEIDALPEGTPSPDALLAMERAAYPEMEDGS